MEEKTGEFEVWQMNVNDPEEIGSVTITYNGERPPQFIVRTGGYQQRDRLFERYKCCVDEYDYYVEVEPEKIVAIPQIDWTDV